MKLLEKIILLIALIGLFLKLLNIPGSGIILVTSLPLLSLTYLILGFYLFSNKDKKQHLVFSVIYGILLSIIPIGILFKLQHWQGSNLLLSISTIISILLLIISFSLKVKNGELKDYYKKITIRTASFFALSLLMYLHSYFLG